jgi:hypothetical protein
MPDLIRHPEALEKAGFRVKPGMTDKESTREGEGGGTSSRHPAKQTLQIFSFRMAYVDGMVPGMSHSTDELNRSP